VIYKGVSCGALRAPSVAISRVCGTAVAGPVRPGGLNVIFSLLALQKPSVLHTHRSLIDHQYRSVSDPSKQRFRISDRILHNMEAPIGSASFYTMMIKSFSFCNMQIVRITHKPLSFRGGGDDNLNDAMMNNDVLSLTAEALAKLDLQ